MTVEPMSKRKLLVVCPPDHYVLRNFETLREVADVTVSADAAEIQQQGAEAEVMLYSSLTRVPPMDAIWPELKNLKWIHSLSAGVEKVLTPQVIESPVVVTNARGVFKRSLAEFTVLGTLFFYKEVRRLLESQSQSHWDNFTVEMMTDRIAAIVGYGEIGRECATLLKAMGMKIYATRRRPEKSANDPLLDQAFPADQLHAMLREADVVVASAPLTPETHHLLSDAEFGVMKSTAIVMNVGRGPVIDEAALVRALEEKKIWGAALDVFEQEPLPAASPLWNMKNVLLSPHCTDRTRDPDWLDLSAQLFVRNFHHYLADEPLENIVDKKAGY